MHVEEKFVAPIVTAQNAIHHFVNVESKALDEAAKLHREASMHEDTAAKAVANINEWIQAKDKITGEDHPEYLGRDSITVISSIEELKEYEQEQVEAKLPPGDPRVLAKDLYNEFERAYLVHSQNNTARLPWSQASREVRMSWRTLAGFVNAHFAKPALTEGDDVAAKLYAAWVEQMDPKHGKDNYPAWENVNPHTRRVWLAAVAAIETIQRGEA